MDELVAEGVDATVTQATRQTPWRPILSGSSGIRRSPYGYSTVTVYPGLRARRGKKRASRISSCRREPPPVCQPRSDRGACQELRESAGGRSEVACRVGMALVGSFADVVTNNTSVRNCVARPRLGWSMNGLRRVTSVVTACARRYPYTLRRFHSVSKQSAGMATSTPGSAALRYANQHALTTDLDSPRTT